MGVLLSCGTPFSFVSFPAFYSVIDASYSKGLQWGFCRGNIPLVTNALVNKIDFAKEWQELKIKLDVPKDLHLQLYQKLTEAGFEISDDASLVLTESMESTEYVSCKKNGDTHHVPVDSIIFIESMGHDVFIHAKNQDFKSSDRLWQLEKSLSPDVFLRISNSVIINIKEVKGIKSALSQKFLVTLSDGSRVDVTRSYYYIFKNKFGI
ncbi:MAG: LytTR family transcriptional regulator DNA-binding domain-containing protein [Oscillospiraceae bacterium]|nr:LytTR family transcriptional regulator DNA-binding domain-containing protein [Oscillospiraceae bacterium]